MEEGLGIQTVDVGSEVLRALEKLADPQRLEFAKRSHPTALRVLGVTMPDLKTVEKDLLRKLRVAPGDQVVELAKTLIGFGVLECQLLAYDILDRHKLAASNLERDDFEALGTGLDNWLSVDSFAGLVAGPAWREGQLPEAVVHGWARSDNPWMRRAAVVATVALNQKARGGTGDPIRTLAVCRLVAGDRDDMVVKSLSWALRELAKRYPAPVTEFLAEHTEVLAARVKREVERKIQTGRKN